MTDSTKRTRIRVAEAVESGVEGLFLFLVRYFRTGVIVMLTPRDALRRLLVDRSATKPSFVLPLTYLSVGLFLLSLIGQVAGSWILDWIWFADDLAGGITANLLKEISLVKVAIQALPGVLVIACFGALLRFTLSGAPLSRRLVGFALSYAFGAQACGLFFSVFGALILSTVSGDLFPSGGAAGAWIGDVLLIGGLVIGIGISVIGPFIFVVVSLRLQRAWRSTPAAATFAFGLAAVAIVTGHVGVIGATRLPQRIISVAAPPRTPVLTIGDLQYVVKSDSAFLFSSMLLKNRSSEPQGWETDRLQLVLFRRDGDSAGERCTGTSYAFEVFRVTDSSGEPSRFVLVRPDETVWLAIDAVSSSIEVRSAMASNSLQWDAQLTLLSSEGRTAVHCSAQTLTNRID